MNAICNFEANALALASQLFPIPDLLWCHKRILRLYYLLFYSCFANCAEYQLILSDVFGFSAVAAQIALNKRSLPNEMWKTPVLILLIEGGCR